MKKTGDEYFDSREFRKMLSDYEEGIRNHAPVFLDSEELTEIADYYQFVGETTKAADAISVALAINPNGVMPLVFKAHQALNGGDINGAKEYVDRMEDKDDPEYVYLTAEIMLAEGRLGDVDIYLMDYLESADDEDREDIIIDVARIFVDYEEFDTAEEWLTLAVDKEHNDYKELMARIFFGKGRYKESIGMFRELIDRNPFSKRDWQGLASAQFMSEDFGGSMESSEYAIAIDPEDPHSVMAKANAMFRMDNYAEALKYYNRYSEMMPEDDFGEYSQGLALVCLDRMEEAVTHLERALEIGDELSPNRASIYQELAFAYCGLKRFDDAIACVHKTEKYDCDHVEMKVVHGHILLCAGKFREAEAIFKQAIAAADDVRVILVRIVASLQENGYAQAAYDIFKQMEDVYGDELVDGYSYMTLCCNDMRRMEEFLVYLEKACNRNPKEAKMVLGHYFPADIDAADYHSFAKGLWDK